MRVLLVDPPPELMAERQRLGHDRRDEVWDGVLHVPPQPTTFHQRLEGRLIEALGPRARARGLEVLPEPNLLDPVRGFDDFKVADLVVVDPAHTTARGVEGAAAVVVELLSPRDESRDKFAFYARRAVGEIWLIEPITRAVELYVLRDASSYFIVLPDRAGRVHSPALDVELATTPGPKLCVSWPGGAIEL
jgi:Uma2 family endonuclease